MSETYSVVVSGQLVEGFELDQVKENIAGAFKLSPAQIDKLLCGKPVALKRGIEKNTAVKLSKRLQDLGAASMIKASAAPAKAAVEKAPAKPKPAPAAKVEEKAAPAPAVEAPVAAEPAPAVQPEPAPQSEEAEPETKADAVAPMADAAQTVDCPRCGHSQSVSNTCGLCKMDLTLHLRRTERRARVVANLLKEKQG